MIYYAKYLFLFHAIIESIRVTDKIIPSISNNNYTYIIVRIAIHQL